LGDGFGDCGKSRLASKQRLRCLLINRSGQVVYNPNGLGLPKWEKVTG
jgi:hypothetical protein